MPEPPLGAEPADGVEARGPAPETRHRVGLSSTGVFLINVAIQAIGFAANYFLYHRIAGPASGTALVGTIQLYLLIASSINGMGDLRIGTAYTFFIARGQPAQQSTGTYLSLRLAMVAGAGIVLFLLGTVQGTGLSFANSREEYEGLAVFMGLPVLWSIQTVYTQLVVARGHSTLGQVPILLESVIRTPLLIAAVFYWPTLEGLTLAYLPGAIASALFSIVPVVREVKGVSRTEMVRLFRYAWPLMGSLFLLYLANNAPPFLVNGYLGTTGLALFNAANAWRILALTVPAAVSMPLFPLLASLHRRRSYDALRGGTWKALRYTAMVVFPAVMVMIIYRVNLINIFANGAFPGPAAVPLAILAASVIPASLSQIIGTSLNAIGYQRLELYLTGLQVAVLFGGAVLLLKPFYLFGLSGLEAVAVAMLGSSIAALVLNTYYMERLMAVRIQIRPVAGILASAAVAFYAVSLVNDVVAVGRYYGLALGIVAGFAVYFLVLAAIGELSREDVRYLAGALALPSRVGETLSRVCWRQRSPVVNVAQEGEGRALTGPSNVLEIDPTDERPPGPR
ncbi:MAG TPA: polysaccharide biosynthesis C-terminal domain-containing protein [Thermoplasmata archaeon]|nr:polysaccharide biosynthesis C-terminal domain-containing protein [Thermoplasmata archaeon]